MVIFTGEPSLAGC